MTLPPARVRSNVGGRGKEVSGPEKTFADTETWMSSRGTGLKGKMLSLLCLRFWKDCSLGSWSLLESGRCWVRGLALRWGTEDHRWDLQARKQSSPLDTGPLGPPSCVSHDTVPLRWGLCCLWGRAWVNWRDVFGCSSDRTRPSVFNRHTGYTGIQDVLPCTRQFCTTYMDLYIDFSPKWISSAIFRNQEESRVIFWSLSLESNHGFHIYIYLLCHLSVYSVSQEWK